MSTWEDPELGVFELSRGEGWCREIDVPNFMAFQYSDWPKRPVYLIFAADDENDIPTDGQVSVARQTINNLERLIEEGLLALVDDFQGRGPDSGMWWHSDIDQVLENLTSNGARLDSLGSPDDLYVVMGQPSIRIQESGYGYGKPCAIIGFEAQFEVEHGVGILTDGEQILGTGYRTDVSPFGR